MGIPSYFAHLVKNHRSIIKKISTLKNPKMDNLYLDCNSFIYDALRNINSNEPKYKNVEDYINIIEKKIIEDVSVNISKCIKEINPTKRVFIAFDGVAPIAKLNQQRNRRYMSIFDEKNKNIENSSNENIYNWNKSSITPGTIFMNKLSIELTKFFNNPTNFGIEQIIVSTSNDPGEGEHKIYNHIRNDLKYHKDTQTVIYGIDADLIMLTINHLHISNHLYLYRETPEFIKSIDKTLNPNEKYILDIPLLAKTIIYELSENDISIDKNNDYMCKIENISLDSNILFDYIFICFFLGNDFLPHFPALNIRTNGIDNLINGYKHVFSNSSETLTINREIKWKNVRKYIEYLSQNELEFIKNEYVQRDKMAQRLKYTSSNNANDSTLMLPLKEREQELYINPNEDGWESRYYKLLFNTKINNERCKEICTNYLEGIEWTMKYYSGDCANWRWKYNYVYPPLLSDLLKFIPYFDHTFIPLEKCNPVSQLTQLCYVLPKESMDLIPSKLRQSLLNKYPEWYNCDYIFIWAFCKFLWESHIDLPNIDINTLENHVNIYINKNV